MSDDQQHRTDRGTSERQPEDPEGPPTNDYLIVGCMMKASEINPEQTRQKTIQQTQIQG